MVKHNLLLVIFLSITVLLHAQGSMDNSIKLFFSQDSIASNNKTLTSTQQGRLYTKIVQLINQTGIAEIGYSNFWVMPKFDVLSTSISETGIAKIYLAQCELFITVSRRNYDETGGATYTSFSKPVTGSASTEQEAVSNAINSISSSDAKIVAYLNETRTKINQYFITNCESTLNEADQAFQMNEYARSIALYFSVPQNAPCYPKARDASIKVYKKYQEDKCRKELVQLKALVATIQSKADDVSLITYSGALRIISGLSASSTDCYAEAVQQITKIENRFTQEQKNQWEIEKKRAVDAAEIAKEMAKSMGKINSSYQPGGGTNVIIAK